MESQRVRQPPRPVSAPRRFRGQISGRSLRRNHCSRPGSTEGLSHFPKQPVQPRKYRAGSPAIRSMPIPLVRRVSPRTRSLDRSTAFGALRRTLCASETRSMERPTLEVADVFRLRCLANDAGGADRPSCSGRIAIPRQRTHSCRNSCCPLRVRFRIAGSASPVSSTHSVRRASCHCPIA